MKINIFVKGFFFAEEDFVISKKKYFEELYGHIWFDIIFFSVACILQKIIVDQTRYRYRYTNTYTQIGEKLFKKLHLYTWENKTGKISLRILIGFKLGCIIGFGQSWKMEKKHEKQTDQITHKESERFFIFSGNNKTYIHTHTQINTE